MIFWVKFCKETTKPQTKIIAAKKQEASTDQQQSKANDKKSHQLRPKDKPATRRQCGAIPCGKRTDFGYAKDFSSRYTIGKLLGHGQFGYTYVATEKASGDRVAVKRIEKNKVFASFVFFSVLGVLILGQFVGFAGLCGLI